MDVRAHAVEIDVRVAALRHAVEDLVDVVPNAEHALEARPRGGQVLRLRRGNQQWNLGEGRARRRFDRHMDENEPRLVDAAEEGLDHADVVEGDRPRFVDERPIVEDVGGIGEERLLSETFGKLPDRYRERSGSARGASGSPQT